MTAVKTDQTTWKKAKMFVFFPINKPDEDWYWTFEILYTLAFFTLFDQSLQMQKSF